MGNELNTQGNTLEIDSLELLVRFIIMCKNRAEESELKLHFIANADLVSAVYYYRKYPNIDDFLNIHMKDNADYFQIQLARQAWAEFSIMTQAELSDFVINKISLVDNSEKD